MSMTDSAVFRNVNTREIVSVAVTTNGIDMPKGGRRSDVEDELCLHLAHTPDDGEIYSPTNLNRETPAINV